MQDTSDFSFRLANINDLPGLQSLMELSIRKFIGDYLTEEQVEASFEIMGVDSKLIEDETYYVVENDTRIIGCGGWSRRATLFGGDHTAGRNACLLDPKTEPARIRAMYTHPGFGRQGIASSILTICEGAAIKSGFRNLELMATVSGEPLYTAKGYKVQERMQMSTSAGLKIPLIRMSKHVG